MEINIPSYLEKVREIQIQKHDLIDFESDVVRQYEDGKIRGPVHLSKNNENELIDIFQYVHKDDWVFSSWRNHYHALLHGVSQETLMDLVVRGKV